MSQELADGDALDSPLLEANDGPGGGDHITSPPPLNNESTTAGVTLHGESVDLRHMFREGPGGHANRSKREDEDPGDVNAADVGPPGGPQQVGNHQSCTLSLDDNQSNLTNSIPSAMEYVRQTVMFLPKKGRSFYYRARYNVVNFVTSRGGSDVGLTPVDGSAQSAASPSAVNNGDPITNRDKKKQRRQQRYDSKDNKIIQKSSLFRSPSTPLLLKLLLPPLIIANHVLFYHGQTYPMWNLAYTTNVTVTATAGTLKSKAAADALNIPHHYEFSKVESDVVETFTYMDAIRKLWKGEGLGDAQTISKVAAALLVVFSGIWPHLKLFLVHVCWFLPFAHGLWLRRDDDDGYDDGEKCCGARRPCSGKHGATKARCGMMCSNGHSHESRTLRSPFLRTLSTLGKWSLADVLVVCILIAVLHLDWLVDPDAIRKGVERELPTLLQYANDKYPDEVKDCARLLGYTCGRHALVYHLPACLACQGLIKNAYHHPEWTVNEGKDIIEGINLEGGGYARLRVQGMAGTYYFCGAVILSILLGLAVDLMDERDRGRVEEDLLDRRKELEFILPGEGGGDNELELREDDPRPPLNEALMADDGDCNPSSSRNKWSGASSSRVEGPPHAGLAEISDRHFSALSIPSPTTNCYLLKHALLVLLSLSSLPLVCFAVTLPTMQRLVFGGGPALLHEVLGMIWEKEYSLITLVKTTGDAGGWDTFLMLTFGLFAVVGPILRSVLLIMHVSLGLPMALLRDCIERPRRRTSVRMLLYRAASALQGVLLPVVDALGAFGCWEVLLVALVMIQLEMPSITDTIHDDPRCAQWDPERGETCIEVRFEALDNFLVVGVAWAVLSAACGLAMHLAGDASEGDANIYSVVKGGEEETRYEFGAPIPQRRSNLNRDRAWIGSSGQSNGQVNENDEDQGDEYFSPLQRQEGRNNGLEQIVFV